MSGSLRDELAQILSRKVTDPTPLGVNELEESSLLAKSLGRSVSPATSLHPVQVIGKNPAKGQQVGHVRALAERIAAAEGTSVDEIEDAITRVRDINRDQMRKDDIATTATASFMNQPAGSKGRGGGKKTSTKTGRSSDDAARRRRAQTWGIAVKDFGNKRMPLRWRRLGLKPSQFADPVNFMYPLDTKKRANNAKARFEQNKDKYSPAEQATIRKRIVAAQKRFGVEATMAKERNQPADPLKKDLGMNPTGSGSYQVEEGAADVTGAGDDDMEDADPFFVALQELFEAGLAWLQAKDDMSEAAGGNGITADDVTECLGMIGDGAKTLFEQLGGEEEPDAQAALSKVAPQLVDQLRLVREQSQDILRKSQGTGGSDMDEERWSALEAAISDIGAGLKGFASTLEQVMSRLTPVSMAPEADLTKNQPPATDPLVPATTPEGDPIVPSGAVATPESTDPDILSKERALADLAKREQEANDRLAKANRDFDDVMAKARPRADQTTSDWQPVEGAGGHDSEDIDVLQRQLVYGA